MDGVFGSDTSWGLFPGTGIAMVLPRVSPNVLSGLMETVAAEPYKGRADLPALATSLQMEIDDLFPAADTLQLIRFAEVAEGDMPALENQTIVRWVLLAPLAPTRRRCVVAR
jgi:NitT/TauT family transport system ATP-binding protein